MSGGGFDEAWADWSVEALRSVGVQFESGLSASEIERVADAVGVPVPPEMRLLLSAGLPVGGPPRERGVFGNSDRWPRWRDPEVEIREAQTQLRRDFEFAVDHWYWHPLLGAKPRTLKEAVNKVMVHLAGAPPMIRIFSHRFLVVTPGAAPNPVLSIKGVDAIVYGADLADYFHQEFGIPRPLWAASEAPRVPVWEDIYDLWDEWRIFYD